MSEYQYYEFQSLDRALTEEELRKMRSLSSRAKVTPYNASFEYHYGDFRADPIKLLINHYDAFFYIANWGNTRLAFRFPKNQINSSAINPYCVKQHIVLSEIDNFIIVDINLYEEEGSRDWIEGEEWLSSLVRLRDDLMQDDYRVLYLAWLKYSSDCTCQIDETTLEPPVPAGLNELTPALNDFIEICEINPYLVKSAALQSEKQPAAIDLSIAINDLSRNECDDYLIKVLNGEKNLHSELRKKLMSLLPTSTVQIKQPPTRTIQQLLSEADNLQHLENQKLVQEIEKKRKQELQQMASRKVEIWSYIDELIQKSQAKYYNEAVELLIKLNELSLFEGTQDNFQNQLETKVIFPYKRKTSLMKKIKQASNLYVRQVY